MVRSKERNVVHLEVNLKPLCNQPLGDETIHVEVDEPTGHLRDVGGVTGVVFQICRNCMRAAES